MDRKEAETSLKNDWYINNGNLIVEHDKVNRFLEACGMGIKALHEPERKWIPVSERLPEEGYGVLVTVSGKHDNIIFVNALEIAEYRNTEGWIIEGYLDWLDPDVIAWQPLPECWKGENNG